MNTSLTYSFLTRYEDVAGECEYISLDADTRLAP